MFPVTILKRQTSVPKVTPPIPAKATAAAGSSAQSQQYIPIRNISVTKAVAERKGPPPHNDPTAANDAGTRHLPMDAIKVQQLKQLFNQSVQGIH